MYYLIYIPLYLLSLLPQRVLHFIADLMYGLVYYVIGYRKDVVFSNLKMVFPEKTEKERIRIAKNFYHNFIDTIFETVKFVSWKLESFDKHLEVDLQAMEPAYASGKNVYIVGMHNFNWEFANWGLGYHIKKYPFLGIYMPMSNKTMEKIIFKMRSRTGTILLPATRFKDAYLPYRNIRHVLATVADQSPGSLANSYWLNFFGKPTAFVKGTERGARTNDTAVVFAHFFKTKRGHYRIETELLTTDLSTLKEGELTIKYVEYIEKCIRKDPANYLWSHRRWKHQYKPEYGPILNA
jgi:Kdo2-lipid IVA lauroyltransferase/acyltransferase